MNELRFVEITPGQLLQAKKDSRPKVNKSELETCVRVFKESRETNQQFLKRIKG